MVVAGLLAFAGGAHAEVFYSASVDVDPLSKRVTLGLEYAATENEPMAGKIVRACWNNRYGRRVCLSKAIPEPLGTDSSQIIFQRVRPWLCGICASEPLSRGTCKVCRSRPSV
jgi:hypothetical protein